MQKSILAVLAAGLSFVVQAQLSVTPCPQSADTNSWWQQRFAEKQALVKAGGSKVVFLGDSITHFWETNGHTQWTNTFARAPYNAIDLGFSADRTEHVLWRIDHGEFDGYQAKAIVLMIGTNNGGHRPAVETPADTILGIRQILLRLRAKQPDATIILLPVFPRGEKPTDSLRVRNDTINTAISKLADGKHIVWCDFNSQFLTSDGTLTKEMMPDRLHPSAAGYEIWVRNVKPLIDRALGLVPAPVVVPKTARPASRIGSRDLGGWWLDRLAAKRNQICEKKNHAFDIVFFGDSITHNWERAITHNRERAGKEVFAKRLAPVYDILNIGYGGDRTEHLVWRAENGELDGYTAKLVMLMIGANNSGDSPEDVAAGIRKILDLIAAKQPKAQTLLLPIFPCGQSASDALRVKNDKTNALIKNFADGKKVVWCDFNAKFLNADGSLKADLFMKDCVHPVAAGYEVWTDAVLPYFKAACGK